MGKTMNIFERLRSNKQEKIAAVQRKIIAVRAAEDLDRRTNAKRSKLTLVTFENGSLSIIPTLGSLLFVSFRPL